MSRCSHALLLLLLAVIIRAPLAAEEPTVGWLGGAPGAYPGLTLVSPNNSMETHLVDNYGRVVNSWTSAYRPGLSVYLLEDGNLLRTGRRPGPLPIFSGGAGGIVQILSWDNAVLWEFEYSSTSVQQHHDVEYLPNGNILILAWEQKTSAEAIAAGRDPALLSGDLWPEHIIEVEPVGSTGANIVWEWHLWDHLVQDFDATQANFGVVADHPELVDLNYANNTSSDWNHANSIDYNAELDQILLSVRSFDEIWVIDHSTTTAEAAGSTGGNAGRGGDILYRWGNPETYGAPGPQLLYGQHCAEWVPPGSPGAGNITIFNNGAGQPGPDWSTVVEIVPPLLPDATYDLVSGAAYGPDAPIWTYEAPNPTDFFSQNISGAQRLPNGNTLICEGARGHYFEVSTTGEIVWRYENPITNNNAVAQGTVLDSASFRTYRYGFDYPGLLGQDLTPGVPLETYGAPFDFDFNGTVNLADFDCFADLFTGPGGSFLDPIYTNTMGHIADSDRIIGNMC
ncbi:MAG: aryl-sulfate sulfotransferase [Planctomycetota bacterium]